MASGAKQVAGKDRTARQQRERARVYEARTRMHAAVVARRRRDNVIAAVAGGAIVIAALLAQTVYFVAGPGVPVPTPAPESLPTPWPTPNMKDLGPLTPVAPLPTTPAG